MFATRIKRGMMGGLMGGLVFGAMMGAMGMLPMIGKMVGQPNAVAGFLIHMMMSLGIGAGFGLVLGSFAFNTARALVSGLAYGAFWWILGPLTMMPMMMGMGLGVNWNMTAAQNMMPSLMGHIVFGLVLGFVFSRGECFFLASLFRLNRTSDEKTIRPAPRAV